MKFIMQQRFEDPAEITECRLLGLRQAIVAQTHFDYVGLAEGNVALFFQAVHQIHFQRAERFRIIKLSVCHRKL